MALEPRLLKGFRDFLPAEQAGRQAMIDRIARAFETCGFAPLSTPAIEHAELLLGKYGDEGEKLLYRFEDHGGRDVALRYDLTVPLARVVAQYRDLPRPFRRYQVGTVWRAEKPAHGRFREFVQCDADIVGSASPLADADCLAAGILALQALDLHRFQVRIGHRGVLDALLDRAGLPRGGLRIEVLRVLDKWEKVGRDAVAEMLAGLPGMDSESAGRVLEVLGDGSDWERVESLVGPTEESVVHLRSVLEAVRLMGYGDLVGLDLRIARGLDYYTGTVYETHLLDLPGVGSVMSGGRYDALLRTYGLPDVPSVGVSIGVDRLFAALTELGRAPEGASGPQVVLCVLGEGVLGTALALLTDLRRLGIRAEVALEPRVRLKKQIEYAVRRQARHAIVLGDAEVREGRGAVKDLETGQQQDVPISDLPHWFRRLLLEG